MGSFFMGIDDWISNALSGKVTANQASQLNDDLYRQMIQAGATPEQAQAAVDEQNGFIVKDEGGTVSGISDAASQLGTSPGFQAVTQKLGFSFGAVVLLAILYLMIEHESVSVAAEKVFRKRKVGRR